MDITRKGREGWKDIEKVGQFPVDDWSVIKHFKPSEFSCKCGSCHGQLGINFDLVLRLDALRQLYESPIRINSGYRCANHPKTLDNPTSSHNVGGNAVDISVKTSAARFKLLKIIFNKVDVEIK